MVMGPTEQPNSQITTPADDNPPGTMLSRGLASAWNGFNDVGYAAIAGGYNLFVDDENEITGEELASGYDTWSKDADAALYKVGTDTVEIANQIASDDAEVHAAGMDALGHKSGILLDGAYSGIIETVSLLGYVVDGVNHAPSILNILPGEQGFSTFSDRPLLGNEHLRDSLYSGYGAYNDLIGYQPPEVLDSTDAILHFTGEIAGGVALTAGLSSAVRATRAASEIGTARSAIAPRLATPAMETAAPRAATAAEATAPRAMTSVDDLAAVARPGNAFSRAVSSVASPNSPRGIYRSADSVADKLTRLARVDDTVAAERYTSRLIYDIGRGRAPILETELTGLRTSGQLSEATITSLQAAKDASRTLLGPTRYAASHLGDAFRANANVGSVAGLTKDVTLAPLTAARWAVSSPFSRSGAMKLGTVWGAAAADGYFLDHAIQNRLGDAYGSYYRGIGNTLDAVGVPFVDTASEVVAAAVDPDQTIAGTLRDNGNYLAATAAGTVAPVISMVVPGDQTGTHTALDEAPRTETAPAGATGPNGAPSTEMTEEQDALMFEWMESFARSPVGKFLASFGDQPMLQMIAFGIGAMAVGRLGLAGIGMIPGLSGLNNGLTGTAAVLGAVAAAPMLTDMFHRATHNTGPLPSERLANALGGVDLGDALKNAGRQGMALVQG